MMYDDSSGLIASQLGTNDQTSISNHNLLASQFDESSSLAGPSSIQSLLPRSEGMFLIFRFIFKIILFNSSILFTCLIKTD